MIPLGLVGREHWNRHSHCVSNRLIITRNLIPRNRGAACPLLPRLGMPLKIAQIARNSKDLNQIGSVCASSAKRDFASKLSRLLTLFCKVTARVRYRANKSTLGVALAIAPIT